MTCADHTSTPGELHKANESTLSGSNPPEVGARAMHRTPLDTSQEALELRPKPIMMVAGETG
jgi:hypothetical protein